MPVSVPFTLDCCCCTSTHTSSVTQRGHGLSERPPGGTLSLQTTSTYNPCVFFSSSPLLSHPSLPLPPASARLRMQMNHGCFPPLPRVLTLHRSFFSASSVGVLLPTNKGNSAGRLSLLMLASLLKPTFWEKPIYVGLFSA